MRFANKTCKNRIYSGPGPKALTIKASGKLCSPPIRERDVAQWLERGALPMSLPAVRFRIPLGAGFSEKYHVSPFSILGHYFDVVSLGKTLTLTCFT